MTLSTKIEVFMDFTFVRSGPEYMHRCRAFPLRQLGFLVSDNYGRCRTSRCLKVMAKCGRRTLNTSTRLQTDLTVVRRRTTWRHLANVTTTNHSRHRRHLTTVNVPSLAAPTNFALVSILNLILYTIVKVNCHAR